MARLKRLVSAYAISYLGTFLSLSFLGIVFWTSVSSPSAVSSVIHRSGVEQNLFVEIAKKSNEDILASGEIDEVYLENTINEVFNEQIKSSVNAEFSRSFHEWISGDDDAFIFSYDLSTEVESIAEINEKINTDFLENGKFVVTYKPDQSSIQYRPQRSYTYFWWATLLGPILFVLLSVALWFTYKSKLDLLFKVKRMLYYSSIATLFAVPMNFVLWTFVANRMSSYPKAGIATKVSISPIANEILQRMSLVAAFSLLVYLGCFYAIKKYLNSRNFEIVEEKHKNDIWELTVKMTKYYLKKLR